MKSPQIQELKDDKFRRLKGAILCLNQIRLQAQSYQKRPKSRVNQLEFFGLLRSGETQLHDTANPSLAAESRFNLTL